MYKPLIEPKKQLQLSPLSAQLKKPPVSPSGVRLSGSYAEHYGFQLKVLQRKPKVLEECKTGAIRRRTATLENLLRLKNLGSIDENDRDFFSVLEH